MADNFTVYYEYSGDQPIDQAYLYPLSPGVHIPTSILANNCRKLSSWQSSTQVTERWLCFAGSEQT